jgi:hypothetical protein
VAAGEEMAAGEKVAGEAWAPASEAAVGVDVAAPTGEEAGGEDGSVPSAKEAGDEDGSVPAAEVPGSEDGSVLAAEVESGAPAEAEVSPEGGAAAVPASGACANVAIAGAATVVPVVSVAPAAASNPSVGLVGVCVVSGALVPDTDAGDAMIPPLPAALAPLSPACGLREGCRLLSAPPLELLLGWPSAVAVRAQCVASAL